MPSMDLAHILPRSKSISNLARVKIRKSPRARRRPRDQSHAGRRPDRRRRCARPRHGADGRISSRQRRKSARLSDSHHRRYAAGGIHSHRGRFVRSGPFGAKGIGEQALIPTAPAILNAIYRRDRRAHLANSPPRRIACARRSWPVTIRGREIRMAEVLTDDKIRCDACPVLCYIKPGQTGACDRYGNFATANLSASIRMSSSIARYRRAAPVVPFLERAGEWDGDVAQRSQRHVRHRDRRRHDLSRLQARAVHRLVRSRRRRHGHRRHRGHLQLLRREAEDRYRPPSRAERNTRARAGRTCRPRHDRRIRLADAVARRRQSSHRRHEEGRPRHLRDAAGPLQRQGRRARPSTAAPASLSQPASRRSSTAQPKSACASAAARRPSACSPSNGTARSTKSSSSTITLPACCPSIKPANSLALRDTGIKIKGRRSTPGRYFQVAEPGTGWGGTNISDPLAILGRSIRNSRGRACGC